MINNDTLNESIIDDAKQSIQNLLELRKEWQKKAKSVFANHIWIQRYIYDDKQYIFKYIDTLQLARKYLNYLPNHRLETLKNYYGIQEISHRAKQDCLTTQNIYLKIKEIAN